MMSFRNVNFERLAKFNSAASSELLEMYEDFVDKSMLEELSTKSSTFIAPSGIRCERSQWFRLRGTEPDKGRKPDIGLNFTAKIGTACHRMIQSNLRDALKDDWIPVKEYLKSTDIGHTYILNEVDDGLETQIEFQDIPIRFACDGIIRWKGKIYLLEIKTSEFSSFDKLTDPKSEHIDQIMCYSTLLKIPNVIVIYMDRQYGSMKVYEKLISEEYMQKTEEKISRVLKCVDTNIAPDRLPTGDKWCSPSMCKYYKVCKEWG